MRKGVPREENSVLELPQIVTTLCCDGPPRGGWGRRIEEPIDCPSYRGMQARSDSGPRQCDGIKSASIKTVSVSDTVMFVERTPSRGWVSRSADPTVAKNPVNGWRLTIKRERKQTRWRRKLSRGVRKDSQSTTGCVISAGWEGQGTMMIKYGTEVVDSSMGP